MDDQKGREKTRIPVTNDTDRKSRLPATCHPDRPRKTADGLCDSCYRVRRYWTDAEFREQVLEQRRKARDYRPAVPRECDQCGATFTPITSDPRHRFCSRACNDKAWNYSKRATTAAAEHVPYQRADIFERDDWKCGLCRDRIDPKLKHPHPLSGSIDHIVPLSRGGADTPANVQAAHLVCNCRKGERAANEQLRLVG